MTDREFDRMMTARAHSEAAPVSTAKLEAALAQLGETPGTLRRPSGRAMPKRRALVLAFALLALLSATALAATMGLSHFFGRNPYSFTNQPGGSTAENTRLSPLTLLDDDGLSLLRVEPVDSAWIDGRLTLSLLVSPASSDEPLLVGELNGDNTANLYTDTSGLPTLFDDAGSALILLWDNISVYRHPASEQDESGYAMRVETSAQDGQSLIACQINPEFVSAADLEALAADGRFPFRLDLYVSDHGKLRAETVLLSAALPTAEEKQLIAP